MLRCEWATVVCNCVEYSLVVFAADYVSPPTAPWDKSGPPWLLAWTPNHTPDIRSHIHTFHTHPLFLAISLSLLLTCVLHQYFCFLLVFESHYLKFLLSFFLSDKISSSLSALLMVCMFMHTVQCDSSLVHNLVASCSYKKKKIWLTCLLTDFMLVCVIFGDGNSRVTDFIAAHRVYLLLGQLPRLSLLCWTEHMATVHTQWACITTTQWIPYLLLRGLIFVFEYRCVFSY